MPITLITERERLQSLVPAWQELLARCPQATFFSTPDWLLAWWRYWGRGRRLLAVADWEEAPGRLEGLLLLMRDRVGPVRRLQFLGTGGTDYLGPVVATARAGEFWRRALEALLPLPWDLADLQQLPEDAATLAALPEAARGLGLAVEVRPQEPCPYLALPGDWESFRAGLGKKMRWSAGYYLRLAEREAGAKVVALTGPEVGAAMDRLFALHARRWHRRWLPGAFASTRTRAFHRELAAGAEEAGYLRLWGLAVGEGLQAMLYCYRFGGRVYYYQGGFDPAAARYSPGTILVAAAIKEAISTGAVGFDFLRGAEPYKYRWGARDRTNYRLRLVRPGWRGRWGLRLSLGQQEVEHTAKKIAGRLVAPGCESRRQ